MGISSTTPILDLASVQFNPGTDADSARANILRSSTYMVEFLNKRLTARYDSAYADYVTNMQSGQNVPAERRHAPVPPNAWELAPANDDGFVFYQIGTMPVCPKGPDVTANFDNAAPAGSPNRFPGLAENTIAIGAHDFGDYWNTLPADTWTDNRETPTQPDGRRYMKIPAPLGSNKITWPDGSIGDHGGWYMRTFGPVFGA